VLDYTLFVADNPDNCSSVAEIHPDHAVHFFTLD
jgi:hypothetical protein